MATPSVDIIQEKFSEESLSQELRELLWSFPKDNGWVFPYHYCYQGCWFIPKCFAATISFQKHFQAWDTDLLIATPMKAGTTWLKSLVFSTMNRSKYTPTDHPLLQNNPHQLVHMLEFEHYANDETPDLDMLPSPRLFGTHLPFQLLAQSLRESNCRIVYLCRNPRDNFISMWKHCQQLRPKALGPLTLEEAFESFCSGTSMFGPYWDHVLGYWRASQLNPGRVLFLKYEEMKKDPISSLKRISDFLGFPFTPEEESKGMVDEIIKLCSFENLSNLEVNKTGVLPSGVPHNTYFRLGKIGDSTNYLTAEMVEKLDHIIEEKLQGSGLSLDGS